MASRRRESVVYKVPTLRSPHNNGMIPILHERK